MIEPSTKYEHLFVRAGRVFTVMSLSVKFVVNVTGSTSNVTDCIEKSDCVIACDLNMTLPLSASVKLNKTDIKGLLQSVSLYDIQVIFSRTR